MQILVDADACPVVIREILYRAAQNRELKLTLFANQAFQVPASPLISLYQVAIASFYTSVQEHLNALTVWTELSQQGALFLLKAVAANFFG